MDSETKIGYWIIGILAGCLGLFVLGCAGWPHYNVYARRMQGEAELAHAEFSKKVAVETARAKKDAAVMEAEAEVARAEGVAKANKIIGDSLHGNESYLRYLWITGIDHESNKTIVYIPTEGNLPILEAHRFAEPAHAESSR